MSTTFDLAVAISGGVSPLVGCRTSLYQWAVERPFFQHRIELRLERTELENEVCVHAAGIGNLVSDFSLGLRRTAVSKVEQVVLDSLLQSRDMSRQLPNRFDSGLVEGDLMAQERPADPSDQAFRESEALRRSDGEAQVGMLLRQGHDRAQVLAPRLKGL